MWRIRTLWKHQPSYRFLQVLYNIPVNNVVHLNTDTGLKSRLNEGKISKLKHQNKVFKAHPYNLIVFHYRNDISDVTGYSMHFIGYLLFRHHSCNQETAGGDGNSSACKNNRRLKQPELLGGLKVAANDQKGMTFGHLNRVLDKVLLNVTVQGCMLRSLQVLACSEWNVHQLVDAAIKLCVKEKRRSTLQIVEPSAFGLHYSQFTLEASSFVPSSFSCFDQARKYSKFGIPWHRFIENLLS